MFGNLSCYVFLRLYQKMYERLKKAKDLAIAKDERKQRDKDEKELELSLQAAKQMQTALGADAGIPGGNSPNLPGDTDMKSPDDLAAADKEGAAAAPAGGGGGGGGGGETPAGGADGGVGEEELLLVRAAEEEDDLCEPYEVPFVLFCSDLYSVLI